MISNKKSCAIKMLQIALALSLLHVDPDSYLQQRLRNWDSQLELPHGDGWELEMLRAVPMVEYPYANRKTMMPLIEDLIRYDRQHYNTPTQYNVTAYMLNIQNDVGTNQTATLPELQTTVSSATATSGGSVNAVAGATALEQAAHAAAAAAAASTNASNMGLPASEIDVFLNSENFQDQRSVWEQNLADLRDFGDLAIHNPYAGLPLKDEPNDNNFIDLNLEMFLPSFTSAASAEAEALMEGVVKEETIGAGALNDTFPEPTDITSIKTEQVKKEEEEDFLLEYEAATTSSNSQSTASTSKMPLIKREPTSSGDDSDEEETYDVDLSPFFSETDLFKEESEIIDVLWKQDVDLGFSLTQPHLLNNNSDNNSKDNTTVTDDDKEKLKALNELKLDKPNIDDKKLDDNNVAGLPENELDEWAGIPFMVDNETGEYIRLPLDEILNDVLQFADFGSDDNEPSGDEAIASTSESAVAKNNKNSNNDKSNSKIGEDDKAACKNKERGANEENDNKEDNLKTSFVKSDINKEDNNKSNTEENDFDLSLSEIEINSLPSPLFDLDDEAREELADFDIMLQSTATPPSPFHHHHHHHTHASPHQRGAGGMQGYVGGGANSAFHRQATGFHHGHHQGRMSLSRSVSMEQRLQDIASFFNPISSMGVVGGVSDMSPYSHHYPSHPYSYQSTAGIPTIPHQHTQYPPPPPPPPPHPHHHSHHAMLHANATLGDICSTQPHYGHNLGSAVTSSMHLTNSSHETDGGPVGASSSNTGPYKMEHDMMYYTNASSDMNHTTDGFINSILNDEDLHLMDMNDSFCRMVDVNNSTSNNSSVLGGGSGGGLTSGHATGGSATSSTSNGLGMSGGTATSNTLTAGMTTDLLSASAGTGTGAPGVGGGDRLDASSDSAVSSMGSERVPSLSDGEWGEGSDSAQDYHPGKYGGPYDYSYNNNNTNNNNNNNNRLNDGTPQPPVAQKKHQMFGKRYLSEQPSLAPTAVGAGAPTGGGSNSANIGIAPTTNSNTLLNTGTAPTIKYEYEPYPTIPGLPPGIGNGTLLNADGNIMPTLSAKEQHAYDLKYGAGAIGGGGGYSLDFAQRPPRTPHEVVQHNHTYTLAQGMGSVPRPQMRDKKLSTSSSKSSKSIICEDEHLTRDEKRARSLNIPIQVNDIINLPMDEFNERLSKYDLTENQLSLIRDIRRRGKNKVAAQNCRKRKLDQILSLEDEVKEVRRRKEQLFSERDSLAIERKRISSKFATLHRHIFQYLRDPEGNPCSTSEYSLQQAADGSIYLLRKSDASNGGGNATSNNSANSSSSGGNGLISQNNGLSPHQQQQQQQQPHSIMGGGATHLQHRQQQQQQSLHHHHHHHQLDAQAHPHQLTHLHTQQRQQQQTQQQQQQQSQRQHSAHAQHHQTQQKD